MRNEEKRIRERKVIRVHRCSPPDLAGPLGIKSEHAEGEWSWIVNDMASKHIKRDNQQNGFKRYAQPQIQPRVEKGRGRTAHIVATKVNIKPQFKVHRSNSPSPTGHLGMKATEFLRSPKSAFRQTIVADEMKTGTGFWRYGRVSISGTKWEGLAGQADALCWADQKEEMDGITKNTNKKRPFAEMEILNNYRKEWKKKDACRA